MNPAELAVRMQEALEDGDDEMAQSLAATLQRKAARRRKHPHVCECGDAFVYPGELDRHRIVRGHGLEAEA